MSLTEQDIQDFLSSAETDFLHALAADDTAVEHFMTRWLHVRHSVEGNAALHSTTLALVNTVSDGIARVADMMITRQFKTKEIEADLCQSLANDLACDSGALAADARTHLPLPPYIEPCYDWLLQNLHNPYPSKRAKDSLLASARRQHEYTRLPSPPPSPSPLDSDVGKDLTLDDIERWFTAARARIGWSDLCRTKFQGSRPLMLQAARLMWADEEGPQEAVPRDAFSAGCVRRQREDTVLPTRSPYETLTYVLPPVSCERDDASRSPSPPRRDAILTPDVELAFALIEEHAKEMYAHVLQPSELVGCILAGGIHAPEGNGVLSPEEVDPTALSLAFAEASHDRRRNARREQRLAKQADNDARQRAQDRKFYPSPEPEDDCYTSESEASDDESDSASSAEDSAGEESDAECDAAESGPFGCYSQWHQIRPRLAHDYDSDDTESESDDEDDSDSDSDDAEESDVEEEDVSLPTQVAGNKRGREDSADEDRLQKRIRKETPIHAHLSSHRLPSPVSPPRTRGAVPPSPTTPRHEESETTTSLPPSSTSKEVARLVPPSAPLQLGLDGVPVGTVRPLRPSQRRPHSNSDLKVPVRLPGLGWPSGGIKVTGDPTPWVNWNLEVTKQHPQIVSAPSESTSPAQTTVTRGLRRSSSISSIASTSSSSSSSSSSDTASLFSVSSTETDATEPEEYITEKRQNTSPRPLHPLFDPNVWSKYDLNATSDGEFHRGSGRQASAFVPTKVHVEAIDLRALPTKHWNPPLRSPVRLASSTAAPVVSYHDAVGTISSPSRSSFGEGQLTATLPTGRSAGNVLRKTTPVKRRSPPIAQAVEVPSSLVEGILSSGLADVCKETPLVKAPKKDRRYAERAERRASKSSPVDSAETVQARLAEIELQAARLEAERQTLQRLASVGG
ncbi:hypothetical protein K525DRAFT_184460 [Schizophyllum commune Loenen D]|nr:hypothetical protein K525DRAFT_184460 [Schizophyllum commune Loenen D]